MAKSDGAIRPTIAMTTFVLVPGAWLGGWCWKRVRSLLRQAGHEVFTPTLTGLGERFHLGTPDTDLDTHVEDVVSVIDYEDLNGVTLVGHSYAGLVVTGVLENTPERVSHLVYLDALFPANERRSLFDYWGSDGQAMIEQAAAEHGDGWRWPMLAEPEGWVDITHEDERWVREKATPQPIGTLSQPMTTDNPAAETKPHSYVLCTAEREDDPIPEMIRGMCKERGWPVHELDTGHWPMISKPEELAELLVEIA